jgi:23S rRNA (cytidine1920-2'-O)/16S rRNA (cytidine1409-2'-O)-methyltransferase
MARRRVDVLLVERGLAPSREKARAAVLAGQVWADGQPVTKPGQLVDERASLSVTTRPRFVSRGGEKLAGALAAFELDVSGRVALDAGASTGGFTDCLLQAGAARVYAVDVGYGQLDYRLRTDPRVVVMERTNLRHLTGLPEPVDIATLDLSFISLTKVLEPVRRLLRPGGLVVALVKPQFEARPEEVGRGGVVRDPLVHAAVLGRVAAWAVNHGFRVRGLTTSPVRGADGNREFFLLLQRENGAGDGGLSSVAAEPHHAQGGGARAADRPRT